MKYNLKTPIRVVIPVEMLEEMVTIKEQTRMNISVLVTKAVSHALKHREVFDDE